MRNRSGAAKIVSVGKGQRPVRSPSGRSSPLSWVITGAIIIAAGIAMLAGGAFMLLSRRDFLAHATRASATVVGERRASTDSGSRDEKLPILRFEDAAGKIWRVDARSDESVGRHVDVYYPAADPTKAIIGDWDTLWSLAAFLIGMSTVPLLSGIWTVREGWRGMRHSRAE